jgi:hypothetical protein
LQMTCCTDRPKELTCCVPSETRQANDRRQTSRSARSPAMEPIRPPPPSLRPVAPLRPLIFQTGIDHIASPVSTRSILPDYLMVVVVFKSFSSESRHRRCGTNTSRYAKFTPFAAYG